VPSAALPAVSACSWIQARNTPAVAGHIALADLEQTELESGLVAAGTVADI